MRYHAFFKPRDLAHVHEVMRGLKGYVADYVFVEMAGSDHVAMMVRYAREDAPEALAAKGLVTWPHIIEYDARLEDAHHIGIVPAKVGVLTGDTPLAAARKLYAHLGNHAPFRPLLLF